MEERYDEHKHESRPQMPSLKKKDNNPHWHRDELILALDFYLRHRSNLPSGETKEIADLSLSLRQMAKVLFPGYEPSASFRNTSGVYMKLMNFRRLDPKYTSEGKKGLSRGAKGDEDVWEEFASDADRCRQTAKALLKGLADKSFVGMPAYVDDDDAEAAEGRLLTRKHLVRERDRSLVKKKREQVWAKTGKLSCEVCDFDFSKAYGKHGDGFIECHHTKPLSTLPEDIKTHINDLALVCANCHRMLHRNDWPNIQRLRTLLAKANS